MVPVIALAGTVARKLSTLFPAVTSPCVPSLYSGCEALPPMLVRLTVPARPVLGGVVGVTVTVNSVAPCAVADIHRRRGPAAA